MGLGLVAADLHKHGGTWVSPAVPVSNTLHHYGVVVHQIICLPGCSQVPII